MEKSPINPWDWQESYGFSHAWKIENPGTILELSGQTAVNQEGEVQHTDDIVGQAHLVFENLKTVLSQSGADLTHVVKLGAYLTKQQHAEEYARIQQEYFPDKSPSQTLLVVEDLALPGLLLEVEATAYLE